MVVCGVPHAEQATLSLLTKDSFSQLHVLSARGLAALPAPPGSHTRPPRTPKLSGRAAHAWVATTATSIPRLESYWRPLHWPVNTWKHDAQPHARQHQVQVRTLTLTTPVTFPHVVCWHMGYYSVAPPHGHGRRHGQHFGYSKPIFKRTHLVFAAC